MSLDNARAAYPILIQIARDLAKAARDKTTAVWVSYDDFCAKCKDVGVKDQSGRLAVALVA